MNGLDIVLFNVVSYLGGILSGIYIHYKMTKSKKEKKEDNIDKNVRETDVTEKYNSPVLTATPVQSIPVPSAPPPPINPSLTKRITITTE
jgi:hypothetical protein